MLISLVTNSSLNTKLEFLESKFTRILEIICLYSLIYSFSATNKP